MTPEEEKNETDAVQTPPEEPKQEVDRGRRAFLAAP